MSLLLVVVLLFFSSSCSLSSGQYYVSDDCSSVTQSPCHPLSVYAGDMSQYNNTIFYFIGKSSISNHGINIIAVKNVTLHGLDQSSHLYCQISSILVHKSSHINISGLTVHSCPATILSSNNITIINSFFITKVAHFNIKFINAFDVKVLSSVFIAYVINFKYDPLPVCSNELPHYSLILTNVTLNNYSTMELVVEQGTSFKLSIIFDHLDISNFAESPSLILINSLVYFFVTKTSFHHANSFLDDGYDVSIVFQKKNTINCSYPDVELTSTIVFEDCQFYHNPRGLSINSDMILPGTISYHFIIRSCQMYDNMNEGLFIDGTYLRSTQIDIIDTELIGNGGNEIMNSLSNSISISNFTVANSTSTGLTLKTSIVTIKNNLLFKNNTGVVGGGLAMNDSSRLILTSSANLEFIDNHASYKGGGIYIEESLGRSSSIILVSPNIPLTLINNTAGVVGGDMYGYRRPFKPRYQFKLANPHISSTGDAVIVGFCYPINATRHSIPKIYQHVYPGQTLKFHVTLLGFNYFGTNSPTDGIIQMYGKSIYDSTFTLVSQKYVPNTCSLIEYTPNLMQTTIYQARLSVSNSLDIYANVFDYIVNECPVGFSTSSSQSSCTCSQSVSRENVTCDINSLNITHSGLLWIGTYHTSTPFNANETNPNACIINEDCLLYCSPNPVTFKLNHTDTQCVNNRGQRMCGSCTEGYSLLMGSNKCGQCHNNYMMIGWIALFAVMGVLLVVLLIALNLTVSVGTLNGLLFYANIVKLYEPVFSRKGALPVLSQVISWINLDFGFEICSYNGMDSYAKQWLQFAFPLYLWIIIIIIIQLCRRYGKISRLMGSHAVPVLSTLFLLSYTKLVRTIVIVLHKREVTLHGKNESVRSVSLWYEDPNVEYAKGKHAGLFGFALLVSVFFVIPYTLFLLLNPIYEKHLSNFKILKNRLTQFKPIIDAYSGPMKDEYRFWPGLLLVARIPVLLSVTLADSFIQSHSFLLSMLLIVLAIVLSLGYCFGGVYKKRMNNVLEVWFLFNLCIMVGLSVALNEDSKVLIWYNTCLSVFNFSFVLIVFYHLYLQLSHMKRYDALIKKLFKKQDEDDEPLLDLTESVKTVDQQRQEIVPSSTDVKRSTSRESVVELF